MKAWILAAFAASTLMGCGKQVADFVDRARDTDPIIPKLPLKDDAAAKISPARIEAKGPQTRMEANFTTTNRVLKGNNIRASITTSRSSN